MAEAEEAKGSGAEEETVNNEGDQEDINKQEEEEEEDELSKIFNNYESDVKGKMLSKYFSKALVDANIVLPEVEVRDLHFLADPKSCGWINKQDFLKVMDLASEQQKDSAKLVDLLRTQFKGSTKLEDITAFLKEDETFDPAAEEELKLIFDTIRQSEAYQKDRKSGMDLEEFVRVLLHPENKGSESPLDLLSKTLLIRTIEAQDKPSHCLNLIQPKRFTTIAMNEKLERMEEAETNAYFSCSSSQRRVQLDAITHNELGDPDALVEVENRPDVKLLQNWNDLPNLRLLNLRYDALADRYITMIATEMGMIPPSSVPVILREYNTMGPNLL
eukprot:CAMPEP_0197482912 /NCGR_PEP_ID=MMETSP1309-20131121/56610_1 /TAXON_ID=464262 /ORGANISM="Genus nov. species nov., Strain RCC998" /LENGTH=330 /DNA_ID=CAMNT_0043025485 /DNA_START=534 /DNA_END=1527 /DNA_ORIENTATION=-